MLSKRANTCPLCGGLIAPEKVTLGDTFDCGDCGVHLSVSRTYRTGVKLTAFLLGFLLVLAFGFRGPLLLALGGIPGLFLIRPVWRFAAKLHPPTLVSSPGGVLPLGLDRR